MPPVSARGRGGAAASSQRDGWRRAAVERPAGRRRLFPAPCGGKRDSPPRGPRVGGGGRPGPSPQAAAVKAFRVRIVNGVFVGCVF